MDEGANLDRADPDDVFGLLAKETRIGILRTLWTEDDGQWGFEELRTAVGVRDSGQFNYHLDQLVDQFVDRSDEG